MLYFSYGSNMSSKRLKARVPSANFVTIATLDRHDLRFHKKGKDGSSKCDAHETGNEAHAVMGVVFDIFETEKPYLDSVEGLGHSYEEKTIEVATPSGETLEAFTYYAVSIDSTLFPYHWYKHHVLTGAREYGLPESYIARIGLVESISDPQPDRHEREMAIYIGEEG
ncbi:MAG: gamma-glutamylcyclotransferase family protein [Methylohalobius sp. ZOD2]|nr:gamma-glutamylcyclotransferase [Methylothermaceae bacterium]